MFPGASKKSLMFAQGKDERLNSAEQVGSGVDAAAGLPAPSDSQQPGLALMDDLERPSGEGPAAADVAAMAPSVARTASPSLAAPDADMSADSPRPGKESPDQHAGHRVGECEMPPEMEAPPPATAPAPAPSPPPALPPGSSPTAAEVTAHLRYGTPLVATAA